MSAATMNINSTLPAAFASAHSASSASGSSTSCTQRGTTTRGGSTRRVVLAPPASSLAPRARRRSESACPALRFTGSPRERHLTLPHPPSPEYG